MTHRLFSYGTLRQAEVQRELFGGPVPTADDALPGWRLEWVTITDPVVIATSGSDRHPIIRSGEPGDTVPGACLELDDEQLARADDYEVDDYVRVEATLASGHAAWVYVAAGARETSAEGGASVAQSDDVTRHVDRVLIAEPETAEQLMRSRFEAFRRADAAWLLHTWHRSTRPVELDLGDNPRWRGLQIVETVDGGPSDAVGVVEFRATYLEDGGGIGILRERSRFVREEGRWFYVEGEVRE